MLAIDENGNLVIIENKLDDSGKDVIWQSLKYASYCSGLTKNDINDIFQKYINNQDRNEQADKVLCEFLGIEDYSEVELNNEDQRIIMIAANFRKEVTSTALWLLDHNVKIKCIRVTPYELNGQILLDTEQIIPIVDAEEYLIKIATKKQEEIVNKEKKHSRHTIRIAFWTNLLKVMNEHSDLFRNINPSKDSVINCGSGYSGLAYTFVATGNYARVELWINRGLQEENKELFDKFHKHKETIENSFGNKLDWQRLDEGKGSRIAYGLKEVSIFNEADWEKMISFMTSNMITFEKSIKDIIPKIIN